MSGSATPAIAVTPVITKNAHFTYTADSGGKSHRDSVQVWNVGSGATGAIIYVNGNVSGMGFGRDATAFGKKHLLTFAGGKASTGAGDMAAKMNRYAAKRMFKSKDLKPAKITPQLTNVVAKYSVTPANKGSTFIICDKMTPDVLRAEFARALLAGAAGKAVLNLPGDAVMFCADGSATPIAIDGATDKDVVHVHIGYEQAGAANKFLVVHCGDATKV